MKASTSAVLSLLLALLMLAGCTVPDTSTDGTEPPVSDTETTTEATEVKELIKISAGLKGGTDYANNPISTITKIGDPFILLDNGTYYMYATSIGTGFKCWTSTNLYGWQEKGVVFSQTNESFGVKNYWAPEVYKHNEMYYLVYSAIDENNVYHIGIASADSPAGPFKECLGGKPLYSPGYSVIDASLFFDDDGRVYMYYSRDCSQNVVDGYHVSQSYGIELAPDLMSVIGEPVLLVTPDCDWELKTKGSKYIWNEGPCVIKHNGTYYLMYSANGYATNEYSVGYATSDSPLGKYTKAAHNPIIKGDGKKISGSGHNNYFSSPDGKEIYTVYHVHTDPANPSGNRTPAIDKLVFDDNGDLWCFGPIGGRTPLPSGQNGIYKLYDGVKVMVTGDSAGSASALTDEKLPTADPKSYAALKSDDTITITLDDPQELYMLWLWGGPNAKSVPEKITLEINGEYVIEDVRANSNERTASIIKLTNLPEGTKVHTITVRAKIRDGAETADIGEILLQYK